MSQFRLSIEIITLIISHLEYERHTLHSLLTVNRLFFNTVIPILYKNPFRPCFWHGLSKTTKREILYLLLASSNLLPELKKSTTEMSDWALTEWNPPTAPFTVNYLNYYTEINQAEWESIYEENFSYMISDFGLGVGQIINSLFYKHNAEKIKSICLPILNMKPYLSTVTRMASLKRIEYCRIHNDDTIYTNDQNIVVIQDAIEFVKLHVDTFNDTLTEIKIPDLTDLERKGTQLDIQIEDIIKILKRPQVIDVNNSYDFCQYIQGPTADHLRVFGGPLICYSGGIQDWDSASLFQRCPKLEKIRFSPSRPDSFKWAVERRNLLIKSGSTSSCTPDIKLAPLQDVDILCKHCAALPTVQDIFYAFRNTIKSINVVDNQTTGLDPDPLCWDWLLPNLVKIKISEADFSLFDLQSLNLCPSLEELYLISKYEYRSSSTVAEFGPVLKLPNLRKIQLEYGISYKFNFASLKYSPLLEKLILLEKGSSLPIRATDSPCWTWTWDWKLPRLRELLLIGESAVLFQFRLLDSCPPLEHLRLSTEGYHRSLPLDEILRADSPLPSESASQAALRNEFSGKSKFFLYGVWDISGGTLSALLQRYLPHVTEIQLVDFEGLTIRDIINATQKLPHIQYVHSTLSISDADIEQHGMHLKETKRHAMTWRCVAVVGSVNYVMYYLPNQSKS
ncbi:hypothetical protein K7432_004677 [Basidiobolus ranarum]|uniref:F-box domain-containing protein n=1 Tax=Basidiobolus ranarum TaxID=34480 RepID=A0ABR2WXR4_9FUNG